MEAKKRLARSITGDFHGSEEAARADENWARMFQQKSESIDDLEKKVVKAAHFWASSDQRGRVAKLLTMAGLAESAAEADRKLKEGAVRIDGEVISQTHIVIPPGAQKTIRVGKRAKLVYMYFPAPGDRVIIDDPPRQGTFEVVSASFGPMATVSFLDSAGNLTIIEPVPAGALFPLEWLATEHL